jgi:hypothetical protein
MNIPSITSMNTTAGPVRTPEPAERPGQEHDGDSDDKGAGAIKPQAAPTIASNGAGSIVNTKA